MIPKSLLLTTVTAALALTACARRDEPSARELGRETYQAGEKIKKGAKEAAREIREAGKEFRQGYEEARRKDPKRPERRDK
jgi:hypothetical protein